MMTIAKKNKKKKKIFCTPMVFNVLQLKKKINSPQTRKVNNLQWFKELSLIWVYEVKEAKKMLEMS